MVFPDKHDIMVLFILINIAIPNKYLYQIFLDSSGLCQIFQYLIFIPVSPWKPEVRRRGGDALFWGILRLPPFLPLFPGQFLHCFRKCQSIKLHHKINRSTASPTAVPEPAVSPDSHAVMSHPAVLLPAFYQLLAL